jgi:regulator of replication initiation timing
MRPFQTGRYTSGHVQELGKENKQLKVAMERLETELGSSHHRVAMLKQEIATRTTENHTLQAELEDNVCRWERERLMRMQLQEELLQSQASLSTALDNTAKAKMINKELDLARTEALRELRACKAHHRSLLSAKA